MAMGTTISEASDTLRIIPDTMRSSKDRPGDAAKRPGARTQEAESPMPAKKRTPDRGHQVAQARRRAGLTQRQLAERIGVGRATVARIEAGALPTVRIALAIASELGESVESLFAGGGR
jgi:DNA-binding XRE family transcriptional regulator